MQCSDQQLKTHYARLCRLQETVSKTGSNWAIIEGFGFSVEYLLDRDHQFWSPHDHQSFASKDSPTYLYCLPGASGGGGSRQDEVGVHALNNESLRPNLSLSEILPVSFFVTE